MCSWMQLVEPCAGSYRRHDIQTKSKTYLAGAVREHTHGDGLVGSHALDLSVAAPLGKTVAYKATQVTGIYPETAADTPRWGRILEALHLLFRSDFGRDNEILNLEMNELFPLKECRIFHDWYKVLLIVFMTERDFEVSLYAAFGRTLTPTGQSDEMKRPSHFREICRHVSLSRVSICIIDLNCYSKC